MDNGLKVFLEILLDAASTRDTLKGIESIEKNIMSLDDASIDKVNDEMLELVKTMERAAEKADILEDMFTKMGTSGIQVSRLGTAVTIAGAAVTGAFALYSSKYISFMKESGNETDALANRWQDASKRMQNANINIGRSATEALIPFYEKGAEYLEKLAAFISQNPGVVEGVLKAGVTLSVIGAVGTLIGKTLILVSDVGKLLAGPLRRFLASQAAASIGIQAPAAGAAGMAGTLLGAGAAITAGVLISKAIIDALNSWLATTGLGKQIDDAQKKAAESDRAYPGYNKYARAAKDAEKAAEKASKSTGDLSNSLRDYVGEAERAAQETAAMDIFRDVQKVQAKEDARFIEDQARVISRAEKQIQASVSRYNKAVSDVTSNLQKSLSSLEASFSKSNVRAEQDFQIRRAEIIEDGNKRIIEIRKRTQEQLEELEYDHGKRIQELTGLRDAVAIEKENERYEREKSKIGGKESEAVAEARKNTEEQLAEQKRNYQQQKQRRLEDYLERVAELKAQAAERLVQLREEHEAQLNEIRQAKAAELDELRKAYTAERIERINAAHAQIRDLGESLRAEQLLKRQYYDAMLGDVKSFMGSFAGIVGVPGGGSTSQYTGINNVAGTRASGGYVNEGLWQLHNSEFVLDKQTTSAAEQLVGGRLTKDKLMAVLSGGGGNKGITYNDNRRIDTSLSAKDRKAIVDDTLSALTQALRA